MTMACWCADPECAKYGCKIQKRQQDYIYPYPYQPYVAPLVAPPIGCICPPQSEMTCQNPICGRKSNQITCKGQ